MKSIEEVLLYKDKDVVWRFTQHFNISEQEAEEIFNELLKWLWLCATAITERKNNVDNVPPKLVIDRTIFIIDEMWHNFICFTDRYNNFCIEHFGFFLHHYPTLEKTKNRIDKELETNPNVQIGRRRVQYNYVLNKLGKDTLVKWYSTFAQKYTDQDIKTLRLK